MREKVRICISTLLAKSCANARNKYATRVLDKAPIERGLGFAQCKHLLINTNNSVQIGLSPC